MTTATKSKTKQTNVCSVVVLMLWSSINWDASEAADCSQYARRAESEESWMLAWNS
jgi:hypothetical protein